MKMKNMKKILLSSVFGPYGVDDAYSRKENVMELFHNQVTREQGMFSLRCHHHSFGLYFIAENIEAPVTVLDFPTEKAFIRQIKKNYDYVGISFIASNYAKARRMAQLVREYAPSSKIILGGHGTSIEGIEEQIENDLICKGEGVKWFRRLLGEDPDRPFTHPVLPSGFSERTLGIPLKTEAAVLIPGVGCPNACRFCTTSHFFDKQYTPYFDTGKELFDACVKTERKLGSREFFVMDENFLKRPKRARELLDLMEKHNKRYRFGIFSSADTIAEVGVEFMARLGVYFVWIGVESQKDLFEKNRGIDLKNMVRELRDHGIGVLTSTILFLEHHDKDTIRDDIKFAVELEPDFSQFMQLAPLPGTTLYREYDQMGMLRKDIPFEEWHGQHQIWFRHPHFTLEESEDYLRRAFRHEYDTLGSGMLRMCATVIRGYRTLARYDDPMMKKRRDQLETIARRYYPVLPVLKKYAHNSRVQNLTDEILAEYEREFGPLSLTQRFLTTAAGIFAAREAARVRKGNNIYQPKTFRTRHGFGNRTGSGIPVES
jgi:radical SAM superfamily enzyme YgiQ (UPF0313 family)